MSSDPTSAVSPAPAPSAPSAPSSPAIAAEPPFSVAPGFAALGERFFTRLQPTPLPAPYLVAVAPAAAELLGWQAGHSGEQASPDKAPPLRDFAEIFIGNRVPDWADPLATVYSGHQFGVWAGQLGDGRAIRLAEAQTANGPWEIQLKGSGKTPYSRMGDGRAVLRSSIREYLCSEAMAALGIPTARALCIVGSGAPVRRETIETAAVVTRLAPTFIRFGHFEHFAAHDDVAALRQLADFVIDRFMPECRDSVGGDIISPYQALLREVSLRTADLMAQWQAVGFCHGVMNTDNMSILGLTIDYGPFGFLDAFDANHICNHSDTQGRYAYSQQPQVGFWNLHCLAQALLPLWIEREDGQAPTEAAKEAAIEAAHAGLDPFRDRYAQRFFQLYRAKLGLASADIDHAADEALLTDLFRLLHSQRVDYTLFWRNLARISSADGSRDAPVRDLFMDRAGWDAWAERYRARLRAESSDDAARAVSMLAVNPKYVLRNHLAEVAIQRAKEKDFSEVQRLLAVLSRPFDEQPEAESYAALPPDWASGIEVSCSS